MRHTYALTGMHCQSCVNKTGAALRAVPHVTSATVTLSPPQAVVEMSQHVPTERLDQAVRQAGDYRLNDAPSELASASTAAMADTGDSPKESLYPLFLIVGYIAGTVALIAYAVDTWSPEALMQWFMAGFFLVFSFFKLLDLRGFADAYRSYDIVARAWPAWAWAYPFVELALGIAYLISFAPLATNFVTLVVMFVGAVGVLKALLDRRAIRCACLGTALNLPMTKVTLIEDLGMAAMAAAMLALHYAA
ncbi:MAG: cation transporter [Pirellulales bacterium]|nr:cation transporter [Pirellulales bacterium]